MGDRLRVIFIEEFRHDLREQNLLKVETLTVASFCINALIEAIEPLPLF